jgi:hypothetical protein
MSFVRPGLACALLFAMTSCATVADKSVIFHDAQRRYTRLMRFTDYERAGRFVAPDRREEFRERTAALGDLRLSDYELQDVELNGDTAIARVEYVGYRASQPIVVTYVEEQQWELMDGAWQVRPILEERAP